MAKYLRVWQTYLPEIFFTLDKACFSQGIENIQLGSEDFLAVGNREVSWYDFRLEIVNGIGTNNISGSQVARDLLQILTSTDHLRSWLHEKHIIIQHTTDFVLVCQAKKTL